ncbi:uncharacterized protein LOC119560915 isoform X2 [Drosophila subpulchrella]|uniref:uncharacterized protein LOC119560915 isoform X2 n=1 Tax=Drosophila subpulchrella TaxID=1486046 RepID=UPI0018A1468D|nr:uncharacterized protein LOC119560915 isoform X2 [Drosophila subpulchrella]
MSRFSNTFIILFLTIQLLDLVLPAPNGINLIDNPDNQLVSFEMEVGRQSDLLLPKLELQLLNTQQQQDGVEVLRMQLMQLNLLKLLIALDLLILISIYFCAREKKYNSVQAV